MFEKLLSGIVSGIAFVLMFWSGKGLVYLGYGKKGSAALKELEDGLPKGPAIFFSILSFVWTFFGGFFYFAFRDTSDSIFSIVVMIACPVIYLLWFIYARSQVPNLLAKQATIDNLRKAEQNGGETAGQTLGRVPQRETQAGDWQCTCGRVNPKYVSTCACGISKKDVVTR